MDLPIVLDIALGLVLIYLVLSLLASEIQEIVTALLQWRAEHLKRSIEVLLSGNDEKSQESAQALANLLYSTPWIRGLNQEARGSIARGFRAICHTIGRIYRTLTGQRNVFGDKTSGPSYIPAEAFSNSLLDQLQLGQLGQAIMDDRLRRFVDDKISGPVNNVLNDLKASTANEFLLNSQMRQLEQSVGEIMQDFQSGRMRLSDTLDRLVARLEEFALTAEDILPDNNPLTETFLRRLEYIKRGIASTATEKAALIKKLRPSVEELLTVFDDGSVTYDELVALAKRDNSLAKKLVANIKGQVMTPALRDSLVAISRKVELTTDAIDDQVQTFGHEIEKWFDRSMERASGVYKRNSKAVAIIIGLAIAIAINVDTFHITSRLVRDPALRNTLTNTAEQVGAVSTGDIEQDLNAVKEAMDNALQELPFPIGYNEIVLAEQLQAEAEWPIPLIQRRFLGWIISGLAISMGSNFWFNLIKKVVNIRTSGPKDN